MATRRYLDVRYDVTDLSDDEVGQLAGEAHAQAERSDGTVEVEQDESAQVGQVWRDEDGLAWIVAALGADPEWVYVKRLGYPRSQAIQTRRAWLERWTLITNPDGSAASASEAKRTISRTELI